MKYTQIPTTAFQQMQMNAGIMCTGFNPTTGEITDDSIIGATTGGININIVPNYSDMGEDVDNCPKNTKELKRVDNWEVTASGTFVTVSSSTAKSLIGAADVSGNKITPRVDLADSDFADIWFVGDYSDKNGPTNGGFTSRCIVTMVRSGSGS